MDQVKRRVLLEIRSLESVLILLTRLEDED